MKRGQPVALWLAATVLLTLGGCAVSSGGQVDAASAPTAERDLLAEAAAQVDAAKWPEPEAASMMSWFTGVVSGDRLSKSDAATVYAASLTPIGARFDGLAADATSKLGDAEHMRQAAVLSAGAARVTMNDIALVEGAIQTLREHRDIYLAAAKQLQRMGDPVDQQRIALIRADFGAAIRGLGKAADDLAERVDSDRALRTIAAPDISFTAGGG